MFPSAPPMNAAIKMVTAKYHFSMGSPRSMDFITPNKALTNPPMAPSRIGVVSIIFFPLVFWLLGGGVI